MTNPAPRPALRKAPDAHVHPALAFDPSETIDLRANRHLVDADSSGRGAPLIPAISISASTDAAPGATNPKLRRPADGDEPAKSNSKDAKKSKKSKNSKSKLNLKLKAKTEADPKPKGKSQSKAKSKPTKQTVPTKPAKPAKTPKSSRVSDAKPKTGKRGRVDVRLQVPGDVRRQLRSAAKARGTSVDDVVTSVLEGWLPS